MTDRMEPKQRPYSMGEVARIVGVDEWRVKNFTKDGTGFGLGPSYVYGKGRGSRRFFSFEDVLRIAIANELVECGFAPKVVGAAIREIAESVLLLKDMGQLKQEELPVLLCTHGEWRVRKVREVRAQIKKTLDGDGKGVFILHFPELVESTVIRIMELEAQGKL